MKSRNNQTASVMMFLIITAVTVASDSEKILNAIESRGEDLFAASKAGAAQRCMDNCAAHRALFETYSPGKFIYAAQPPEYWSSVLEGTIKL